MRITVSVLVLILSACSIPSEQSNEREAFEIINSQKKLSGVISELLDEKVSGYVLISHFALEYGSIEKARKDLSGPKSLVRFDIESFHLHTPLSEKSDTSYLWGSPLKCRQVVADHGDVVEVKTLDVADEVPEKMGHGGLGADYLFNLTTFVRKIDLIPVLAFSHEVSFKDKTKIKLDPGVAVGIPWNGDESKRAVSVQQMHFEFPIPDSLLLLSYQPQLQNLIDREERNMLDEKAMLLLDGKNFCPVSELRLMRLRTPVNNYDGNDKFVEIVMNGVQFTLQTDLDLVRPYTPNIDRPILTPKYKTPPRWYYRVKEETPVYWDDGRLAGKVRQFFGYQSLVAPGDSTWCEFISELFPNEPLCFKLRDVEIIDNQ